MRTAHAMGAGPVNAGWARHRRETRECMLRAPRPPPTPFPSSASHLSDLAGRRLDVLADALEVLGHAFLRGKGLVLLSDHLEDLRVQSIPHLEQLVREHVEACEKKRKTPGHEPIAAPAGANPTAGRERDRRSTDRHRVPRPVHAPSLFPPNDARSDSMLMPCFIWRRVT